jgi:hypothetical protein
MAHVPLIEFYYVNPYDNNDDIQNLKDYSDKLFQDKEFIKSDIATAKALFEANKHLCPSYKLKSSIIDNRYFTLYLVVDGQMICIMSINFNFIENEAEEVVGINELNIVYYCCITGSNNSRLLVNKVKSFTKNVYLSVTEDSKPYWEHLGATYIKSLEKYKLGGTKRKRKKRKSKRIKH